MLHGRRGHTRVVSKSCGGEETVSEDEGTASTAKYGTYSGNKRLRDEEGIAQLERLRVTPALLPLFPREAAYRLQPWRSTDFFKDVRRRGKKSARKTEQRS